MNISVWTQAGFPTSASGPIYSLLCLLLLLFGFSTAAWGLWTSVRIRRKRILKTSLRTLPASTETLRSSRIARITLGD